MANSINNRRIVTNTLFLYFRMILTLVVTLYTSRVVLNTLGIEDFGIYNVVGGVVTMMAFLSGAMSSATQRFLSFELGKNDTFQLHNVFKMSVNIHLLIILIVVLVAETIGLWFINTKLVIPIERLEAANWVFQCALFSFCCSIIGVPYNATIIAHEKMSAFAYISIVDVMLKLAVVFLLQRHSGDKLENYAIFLALTSFIILFCYYFYARTKFSVARFSVYWNANLFKTLFIYTGWNLFGNLAMVATNQGVNILLNIFFGTGVNAARAISFQINAATMGFVSSLQMAINPQIIKSYAVEEYDYMRKLVFSGAKYSYFLLYIIVTPIFLQIDVVLSVWLGVVPPYTMEFSRLVIVDALILTLSGTLMTAFHATGEIKKYQVIVGVITTCNLPITYFFLKAGYEADAAFIISIVISVFALLVRVILLSNIFKGVLNDFLKLLLRVLLFTFFATSISACLPSVSDNILVDFIFHCFSYWVISLIFIWCIGFNGLERNFIKNKIHALMIKNAS